MGNPCPIRLVVPLAAGRIDEILRSLGDQLDEIHQREVDAVEAIARAIGRQGSVAPGLDPGRGLGCTGRSGVVESEVGQRIGSAVELAPLVAD